MSRSIPLVVLILPACAASLRVTRAPWAPLEKRLAIVAPERFHAVLDAYVRHKRNDLPTELLSLERILRRSPGLSTPTISSKRTRICAPGGTRGALAERGRRWQNGSGVKP